MKIFNIFKDTNDTNEKSIAGFLALGIMVIYALTDIVSGVFGKVLVLNEYIFDAFMWIVLGSFGIAEVGKFFNKKGIREEEKKEEQQ